ncbi:MAG: hypothetical protein N3E51_01360 [Candidatus Micrarchaeota archaeon]|nr:hypothetical protein [Candidatus Micrarchaeota archaeon]
MAQKRASAAKPEGLVSFEARSLVSGIFLGALLVAAAAFFLMPQQKQPSDCPFAQTPPQQPISQKPSFPPSLDFPSQISIANEQNGTLIIQEIIIGQRKFGLNATLPAGKTLSVIYSSPSQHSSIPAGASGAIPQQPETPPSSPPGEPLSILTSSLPTAKQDARYSVGLEATGGSGRYYWSVVGLPSGYSVSQAGVISGVTLEHGTYYLVITVSDGRSSASKEFTLVVSQ